MSQPIKHVQTHVQHVLLIKVKSFMVAKDVNIKKIDFMIRVVCSIVSLWWNVVCWGGKSHFYQHKHFFIILLFDVVNP